MKAVVCHNGELAVETIDQPRPGPGQVLVRVVRAGICGSDLHARTHAGELAGVAGELGYDGVMRAGSRIVLGHEILGEVVSYGSRTRRAWKPGTLVTALPMRRDEGTVRMIGFDEAAPGGFAEYTVLQEAFIFPVPSGVDPDKAAFTEPLAVAWHAVRRATVGKGRPALVIGCGPIGLAVIMMLKAAGVRQIIASDLSPARRALARECGADVVVDPREEQPWTAYREKGSLLSHPAYAGFGMDAMAVARRIPLLPWQQVLLHAEKLGQAPQGPVVFECVGVPGMIEEIVSAAPLRSRVVVVGVCMQPDTFRPSIALHKEIDLRFVFGYDPAEFSQALAMIASGKVDPGPLHTGTVGLAGVAQAFGDLGDPERHAKILLDPGA